MNKKVLITGASGFVGYHIILSALQEGLEVYAAVRTESKTSHLENLNVIYKNLNFNSVESLTKDIENEKYNYIIHAAGITKAKTQEQYNLVNANYTKNIGLAIAKANHKAEKFVFISSLAALGPLDAADNIIYDTSEANPVTSYGKSKLLAEKYLDQIPGLPLIIIRPTAVYGPREKDLFIIVKSIQQNLEPYIGRKTQQFSFVYVKDLADAIIKALHTDLINRSYNISDGMVYDRYALANAVKKASGKKTLKFHIPVGLVSVIAGALDYLYTNSKNTPALNKEKMKELTATNWACDISNICRELNFKPQYNLEKGITETFKWYKQNNWL